MPTYEYRCDACGHAFEQFQSIKADPTKKCPSCGKNKVRRLIGTGAGLIFKGSGFYITDYRDKAYTDKAKADSGAGESSTDKPAAPSSDTAAKPAETKASTTPAPAPAKSESGTKGESKPSKKPK
ncbi:MAG TPA: FmdB family zinc ribbon protein [Tepidisphaeraceae bacterium]|nr:FmdB family zinc ribbon protein [Tepidisphaeraceae bacterium]